MVHGGLFLFVNCGCVGCLTDRFRPALGAETAVAISFCSDRVVLAQGLANVSAVNRSMLVGPPSENDSAVLLFSVLPIGVLSVTGRRNVYVLTRRTRLVGCA